MSALLNPGEWHSLVLLQGLVYLDMFPGILLGGEEAALHYFTYELIVVCVKLCLSKIF